MLSSAGSQGGGLVVATGTACHVLVDFVPRSSGLAAYGKKFRKIIIPEVIAII